LRLRSRFASEALPFAKLARPVRVEFRQPPQAARGAAFSAGRERVEPRPLGGGCSEQTAFPSVRGVDGSHEETVVMISNAKANFQRISPRKARMIVNLIRGRDASDALQLLDFTFKAGAPFVKKLIASAVANARLKRPDVDADALFISKASVDKAGNQNLRRWRPRAQGRATRIAKGVSHIHIELDQR